MPDKINEIRGLIKKERPLIHCITNPISINQCANTVLAVGGSPIMAEHPKEVGEITDAAKALVINLGNITDVRMKSMMISAKTAGKKNIPFVLDMVGVACSDLRRKYALRLINRFKPTVIKGNYSEINAFYNFSYKSSGIDSELKDTDTISKVAVKLAIKYKTIVLASGKVDVVTNGERIFYIKNGTSQLADITGTGCMLGVMCGCCLAVSPNISGVITACSILGICGELADTYKHNGSFFVKLMDSISVLSNDDICNNLNMEEKEVEKNRYKPLLYYRQYRA